MTFGLVLCCRVSHAVSKLYLGIKVGDEISGDLSIVLVLETCLTGENLNDRVWVDGAHWSPHHHKIGGVLR